MIAHRAVDIVQPDLHYHGGFIRSMRVARMAHAAGMLCTPHMSGSGLGYLDAAIFASCIDEPGSIHRVQGKRRDPGQQSNLVAEVRGRHVRVPSGPGFGVTIDPAFLREAKKVTTS